MADWSLTGKRDTEKNYTTTNTIRSYVIVMHIPIIEDVPEGAVEWDLVISHYGCTKKSYMVLDMIKSSLMGHFLLMYITLL